MGNTMATPVDSVGDSVDQHCPNEQTTERSANGNDKDDQDINCSETKEAGAAATNVSPSSLSSTVREAGRTDVGEEGDTELDGDSEINEDDSMSFDDANDDEEEETVEIRPEQLLSYFFQDSDFVYDDPLQAFADGIEPIFRRAVEAIQALRFNLAFAKDFVLKLRALGERKMEESFLPEPMLEGLLVKRGLQPVYALKDAVEYSHEELYDPRQTLVYLYCVMSVFVRTVVLGKKSNEIEYRLSLGAGDQCFPEVRELIRYCELKTKCEGAEKWQNLIAHNHLMLDLAVFLEPERTAISYLIANNITAHLPAYAGPGVSGEVSNRLRHLWEIGVVVLASSLVRKDFVRQAKDLRKALMKVDTARLTPTLEARHAYVHARLLQDCGEFAKALDHANYALQGAVDPHEKQEIEQLIKKLSTSLQTSMLRRFGPVTPEEQWLADTHVAPTSQFRTQHQDAVRKNFQSRTSRKKVKTKSVWKRGETPSPAPSARGRLHTNSTSAVTNDVRMRLSSFSSMPDLSHHRQRMDSTGSCDTASQGGESSFDDASLIYPSDLDESEDDDDIDPETLDRDIRFVNDFSDDDENFDETVEQHQPQKTKAGNRKSKKPKKSIDDDQLNPQDQMESDETDIIQDWYDASKEASRPDVGKDNEDEIELNDEDAYYNRQGRTGDRRTFYPDLLSSGEASQLLKTNPQKYKRCQLKIEGAHKAIAKVLDKDKYSEILIEGRSKASRCYMDDEVVVEVLAEPGKNRGQGMGFLPQQRNQQQKEIGGARRVEEPVLIGGGGKGGVAAAGGLPGVSYDMMVHGKVVGLLKRINFDKIDHPIFFCTLDEIEGHLMRPLCKTVPKIHVMNEIVRKKFPNLKKHRIEVKEIKDGEIVHQRFCDVRPDMREQYVFKVVLLAWRQQTIYPLGAVLSAHLGGRSYARGLQVLSMQQRVPKMYPRAVVEETAALAQQTVLPRSGRLDLTGERVFTIDPPGSKDLDDAISVQKAGKHFVIGVHIADVAAVVAKGSAVDEEARKRAVTFYPLDRKPHPMLPEPLSHDMLSLLHRQERLAFSVFFTFDATGKEVADPEVKKTVIKSCAQLTYEEVQKVIEGDARNNVPSAVRDDILQIFSITSKLRETRQKASIFFVPFDDPRLTELVKESGHAEAHSLIEELMIKANAYIAKRLTRKPRFQKVMMVRCHKAPSWEELREWQEKEGSVTNLVLQLQGKNVAPNTTLSIDNVSARAGRERSPSGSQIQEKVIVQNQVWVELCRHLERGEVEQAKRLAFADSLHPLQCLAAKHWMDLMETAEYKCYDGLSAPDVRHFGLDVDVYCHFTSPIRRYNDLHVHRLLHADLDGRSPDCTVNDVVELSHRINSATSRQKAFGKGCLALKIADSLQQQPLVFRAFVDKVDTEQLTVVVPSLLKVADRRQDLPFSVLGVSTQPELVTDTVLQREKVTVTWKRRIYDEKQLCPPKMKVAWDHIDKRGRRPPAAANLRPDDPNKKKKNNALILYISPDTHLCTHVRQSDWAHIVKTLATNSNTNNHHRRQRVQVPQTIDGPSLLPISGSDEACGQEPIAVDCMTSEKGAGQVSLRPTLFKRVYTVGQVLQIQMSAEPKKGLLTPRVEMLHVTRNAVMCTPHVNEPVLTLTTFATRSVRNRDFRGYADYARDWMPLLEMEAAVEAGNSDGGVVIENVPIVLKSQSASNSLQYRGTFKLTAKFCFDRCIEFGGKAADTIEEKKDDDPDSDNSKGLVAFPLDYLCIRYKTKCSDAVVTRMKQSGIAETVDKDYTWLAHGSVVRVNHVGKRQPEGGNLIVTFVLAPSSPQPPPQLLTKGGDKLVTMEILPKSEVDRRCQEMLLQLDDKKCILARAIAFGSKIPPLDKDHERLGSKDEYHETRDCIYLPSNNVPQYEAIKMALTHSLSLIQGPPGTGKTNTGIKLVYLFCEINRQLAADGKGKKTVLYCGPSNKSVDLVARELKKKLGGLCPKIVRMYGSAIETKDYPVPRGDLRSTRGLRDLCSDPELQDVTLHHLIRESDKPHAESIANFDRHFEKCIKDPEKFPVFSRDLKAYRKLINKATIEELQHYEVILTTCSVGGNRKMIEGTGHSIFQVIIDECAMSTEPQTMVPIVATRAQQVVLIGDHKQLRPIIKCSPAAELGLDQSLFERLFLKFPSYTVFLSKQYRMHPSICLFPSKMFYENMLATGRSPLWSGDPLPFWKMQELAEIVPQAVPYLLAIVLRNCIKNRKVVPQSVTANVECHLLSTGIVPEPYAGMLRPFLYRDKMPRNLFEEVENYLREGSEMPSYMGSQLKTFLADDRIVPSELNRLVHPHLKGPIRRVPAELGKQLLPYLSGNKVMPPEISRQIMPYLDKLKSFGSHVNQLLPFLKKYPMMRSLADDLQNNELTAASVGSLAIPCLVALRAVPHLLVDVRGEEDTLTVSTDEGNERSKKNQLEADKVIEIVTYLKKIHGVTLGSMKVLTQYNAQRHMIEDMFKVLCNNRSQNTFERGDADYFQISTVVSSQGGEWDYVILSTVRSLPSYMIEPNPTHGWCRQNMGFITDRNQVNVALTRARKGLIIVGNVELLECDDVWRKLVNKYREEGCLVSDPTQFPPPSLPPAPKNKRPRQPNATDSWQQVTPSSSVCSIPRLFHADSISSLDTF